ncbi:MAG: Spy/CpxP family protein refolding chaperone [Hydrogenophaga sp.]|uniref:Spy/CpxP family protein refolding chaperone n=1 Tax=Hydrogenophaga sp. TaxID=1904254 RepID=UPI0025BA514B|nr:Spy/CpxP family protein refolding chaperone [Hydrogenophaga sp.]MBT9551463.1 Spy/CpxP family protein refolding chaperone [Hydrogenophaga sp.]
MKLFNKRTLIAASLAAAFVGLSATAIAQNAGGPGMSPDMHTQHMAQRATEAGKGQGDMAGKMAQRMEQMQKRHAEHQAQLKTTLKITAAQEPAWNAYVASTTPTPRMGKTAGEDWSKLTTPQRLDKMQAHKAERDAQMTKRIDAVKTFYAALTPEQQKVFDTQGHNGFHRAGMKGEHGMGGQGGHGGHHGMRGQGGEPGCEGPMQKRG